MLNESKSFLKIYSILALSIVGIRIFLLKKSTPVDLAALIPTFILICNS